jgi:hexosaminidase
MWRRSVAVLAVLLLAGCAPTPTPTPPERVDAGLMLDVARTFYTPAEIEGFIDVLAESGGTFLHLHLSDDHNVGIESPVLGQTLAEAELSGGVYTSSITGRPFLSIDQARSIAAYAQDRGISVVPEMDTPGHFAAAFDLLAQSRGDDFVAGIRASPSELDVAEPAARTLATDLTREIAATFPSSTAIHLGGDEWGDEVDGADRVAWLNDLAAAVPDVETWAWNDGIESEFVGELAPGIRVTWWSWDGDEGDVAIATERRERRASAPELAAAGVGLLNYNSYYLYEVPSSLDAEDAAYTVDDLRANWDLTDWDSDSGIPGPRMEGAAVAIWGEELGDIDKTELMRWSAPHIRAMVEIANS